MADSGTDSSLGKVQAGVRDTRRLIGHKEYNAAMMKARQTLEFMVNLQAERACIIDGGDLKENIDALYQERWISKETCEAYHKLRMLGNKAAHEGDDSAYNANQACQILTQEASALLRESKTGRPASRSTRGSTSSGTARRVPARQSRARSGGGKRSSIALYDILRLLAPVLFIILLVLIIKLVKPAHNEEPSTAAPVPTESVTTPVPETTGDAQTPQGTEGNQVVYRTTAKLNVRPQPSTEGEPIGQLNPGATIAYIRAYNEEWAVIQYGDQEAYVASRYLTTD